MCFQCLPVRLCVFSVCLSVCVSSVSACPSVCLQCLSVGLCVFYVLLYLYCLPVCLSVCVICDSGLPLLSPLYVRSVVIPLAVEYQPDVILVSAGFNATEGHQPTLGGYTVSPQCFGHLTRILMNVCDGRVILALEGGCVRLATIFVLCLYVFTCVLS